MGYNETGEGHRGAIKDEASFAKWLNAGGGKLLEKDYPGEKFSHAETRGGTKKVEDVVAFMKSGKEIKISNKQAKNGIPNHSNSWENNSKIFTRLQRAGSPITEPFTIVKDFVKMEIELYPDYKKRRRNREAYDAVMKAANTQVRDNLTQKLIEEVFASGVNHLVKGAEIIVITDVPQKTYYWFKTSKHPVAQAESLGYKIEYQRNPSPTPLPSMDQIRNQRDRTVLNFGLNVGDEVKLQKDSSQIPIEMAGSICKITKINNSIFHLKETKHGGKSIKIDISLWRTPIKTPNDIGNESGKIFLVDSKNGKRFDLGLRLRVKHNNGVSNLFKQGGSAETAQKNKGGGSFVTVINQDPGSVPSLLDRINAGGNLRSAPFTL